MKRILSLLALGALTVTLSAQPYKDRSLSPEERAKDLVSRLTLEEKASLSMHPSAPVEALGIKAYNWWSEEKQDMVPLPGKYELVYGGSSDAVKKVRYKFKNK